MPLHIFCTLPLATHGSCRFFQFFQFPPCPLSFLPPSPIEVLCKNNLTTDLGLSSSPSFFLHHWQKHMAFIHVMSRSFVLTRSIVSISSLPINILTSSFGMKQRHFNYISGFVNSDTLLYMLSRFSLPDPHPYCLVSFPFLLLSLCFLCVLF